ncbi:MAG TPA: methyltransferase domain-containing protein [Ideonella sp.]|uniref:class I SAM-dependent methyltransferase n=1 Tax=Ideonella sp. TaxID=1929293 RepID=UPI002C0C8926|nr:methyltransferase domain-containing protein [Ideonella sp.]HSI50999.1 methyltransferase domain-containing protein [Ideonella sp.]
MTHWLETPPGRYLLDWEQARIDEAVADLFGFHALQLGLPQIDALRCNRMPRRWLAGLPSGGPSPAAPPMSAPAIERPTATFGLDTLDGTGANPGLLALRQPSLLCEPEALPFEERSLDLVVMPHTLELAADAHRTLAEVARVLRPEGRVVISGLNPVSLWGLRQRGGRVRQWLGAREPPLFLPSEGEFIGYWRLRDWLRLLGMELEIGRLGCYRPPLLSPRWLERFGWMESVGGRWWPVLGAVYFVVAVKRVRGMRLIGLARNERKAKQAAPAAVANRQGRLGQAPAPGPRRPS